MYVKAGDIVIEKGKHSCKVKFVEGSDESGILLVDGIKDEFFEPNEMELFHQKYQLLCKKENRLDM